ncbi:helix-turn-helix transcriptional regulator [Sphaerimonospora thailandensis]|uniref:Transcriptional regulator n=1 Tax=Sphaerimonospora thailandensis TaxID=795644 RepID=A0A8J3RCR7_9ACTN|nr:LuxR family transcriptional regulator [Sphaerimonospora thailandensis]GIH72225.1 transcriptional regulator [Sphaerimonospora thailandensis]
MLQEWGLDAHADAIYRLVLTRKNLDVAEVATQVGVSETSVRSTIDKLVELSLLRRSSGTLRAGSPSVAFHDLLQRQRAELSRRQEEFMAAQQAVAHLISEYSELCAVGARHECDALESLEAVRARIETLAYCTKSECLSFMPGGAQSPESLEASRPLDHAMLERGVTVRTVYMDSACNDTATLNYARWMVALGGEVRTMPTLPLRIVIFDREVALIPLDPECSKKGAVEVCGAGIIAALIALFEHLWTSATPLGMERRCCDNSITVQERELLRLLAQGLTDEATSKKLGIGLRTHRRMVAGLMDRLGARSRFEAGVKAVERGWLTV